MMNLFKPQLDVMRIESKLNQLSFNFYAENDPEKLTLEHDVSQSEFPSLYSSLEKARLEVEKAKSHPDYRKAARLFYEQIVSSEMYKNNIEKFSVKAEDVSCD